MTLNRLADMEDGRHSKEHLIHFLTKDEKTIVSVTNMM